MAKKPPNSIKDHNFGHIQIDPEINALVDSAIKTERAIQESQQIYREYAYKRGIVQSKQEQRNDIIAVQMDSAQIADTRRSMLHDPVEHRKSIFPSNHNKRDQGYNGWSQNWNREARTGVIGKPPTRRNKTDPIYSKYPFAPKE